MFRLPGLEKHGERQHFWIEEAEWIWLSPVKRATTSSSAGSTINKAFMQFSVLGGRAYLKA